MKIAYLDCFSGISGDMFVAALVDAGVPLDILQQAVDTLNLGVRLDLRRVNRSGIDAAKIDVLTADGDLVEVAAHSHGHENNHDHSDGREHGHSHTQPHEHNHPHPHEHAHEHDPPSHSRTPDHVHGRSLAVIRHLIRSAPLPEGVQYLALSAFDLLGHAEARIHNVPVETIHFHEVGSVDAIADIVAASAGCHWLATQRQIDRWFCSPLNVGGGHIHCAHGKFPVPAPATLELLRDLPIYSSEIQKELVTPTGAALLRALHVTSTGFPSMRMQSTGYGAGSRDIPNQPNVLRLILGESATTHSSSSPHPREKIGIIETTIDDATPELLSHVADRLLAAGAADVHRIPVQMKKGRIGTQLTILCSPALAPELQQIVFLESTTLGLRYREEERFILERAIVTVETSWGSVRIKVGISAGAIVNAAPEFEDCKRLALEHSIPLKHVMQAAMADYQLKASKQEMTLQENHS
jgi:uncharacterized protein (TIGR00299 family) protein